MKKLIQKYNSKDNILVVSEYSGSASRHTGLSIFSKNTVKSIRSVSKKARLIVLADIIKKRELYEEKKGVLVVRCFKKNNPLSLFNILYYAIRFYNVKSVLFEFEFASFGNVFTVILIPFLLFCLRFGQKHIVFVLHQVVVDLKSLHTHLGLKERSIFLAILQSGLHMFYRTIGALSNTVVVLEQEFFDRLTLFVKESKIAFIPHGIPIVPQEKKDTYRKDLNLNAKDFILLVFGYVAWYKGIDRLIEAVNELPKKIYGKKVKLIIAGGYSPTQAGTTHYERYYATIKTMARNGNNIRFTGFVPEKKIKQYFCASDLCVLPYKEFISSSQALSLALAFQKPLILSDNLISYSNSNDFKKAMKQSKLSINELFVPIKPIPLAKIIRKVIQDKMYNKQIRKYITLLIRARSWKQIAHEYVLIFKSLKSNSFSINGMINTVKTWILGVKVTLEKQIVSKPRMRIAQK